MTISLIRLNNFDSAQKMVKTDRLTKNDENRLTLSFDSAQKSADTDRHTHRQTDTRILPLYSSEILIFEIII